ncbi:hypothetical protein N7453_006350 [Penicillium expansum]|nr:hypothetical protein N7453_006350 [Penicillium expansum]
MVRSQETAQMLLDYRADVNELSFMGRTPLHIAVENGDLAMAGFLLDHGADVDAHGLANGAPSYFHSTMHQCSGARDT